MLFSTLPSELEEEVREKDQMRYAFWIAVSCNWDWESIMVKGYKFDLCQKASLRIPKL